MLWLSTGKGSVPGSRLTARAAKNLGFQEAAGAGTRGSPISIMAANSKLCREPGSCRARSIAGLNFKR